MSDSWFNRDIPVCQQEKGTRIAMIYDCLQVTVCKCRELFSVLDTNVRLWYYENIKEHMFFAGDLRWENR